MSSSRRDFRRTGFSPGMALLLAGVSLSIWACAAPGGGAPLGMRESQAPAAPMADQGAAGGPSGLIGPLGGLPGGSGRAGGPGPVAARGEGQPERAPIGEPRPAPPDAGDTVTVTASRREQSVFDTPWAITIAGRREIERKSQLTILDTLDDRAGIWIEKHTSTKSDPVMRGFSGANLLALVDGCTLTTKWGEGGFATDDMYGKVDAESIERIEIIRGPGSALYGSNALGGVINFITRSCPFDYTDEGFQVGGRSKVGYGSNPNYYLFRQEVYFATPDVRFFLGGSKRKAGHVDGGRGMGTQWPTSGEDMNFDLKTSWKIADGHDLELAIQYVDRKNLHRFYRPTQKNWNDRHAFTLTYRADDFMGLLDSFEAKAYFQNKRDVRIDRAEQPIQGRGEGKWFTYSGDLRGVRRLGDDHTLTVGLHYNIDIAYCPDDEQFHWKNAALDRDWKVSPDTVWDNLGLYIQDEWQALESLTITGALRYDRFFFESKADNRYENYVRESGRFLPTHNIEDDEFTDTHQVISGGLGAVYSLNDNVNLVANYTRGFRLFPPRFGVVRVGYGYLVPEDFKDPITNDTFEIGAKLRSEDLTGSAYVWYSEINNWQSFAPGSWQGQEFIEGERIHRTYTGKANLYGFEADAAWRLAGAAKQLGRELSETLEGWYLKGAFTWNWGTDFAARKGTAGKNEPMRHTQPMRLVAALAWEDHDPERNAWFELKADMVASFDRIPDSRWAGDWGYRSDPQDRTSPHYRSHKRMPGYTVLHVRGGLDIYKDVSLTGAVENLTNKNHRRVHSRWDEAGINFLTTLTVRF